jgi:uncharacterized membrane protein YkvA (DUF1232 family)
MPQPRRSPQTTSGTGKRGAAKPKSASKANGATATKRGAGSTKKGAGGRAQSAGARAKSAPKSRYFSAARDRAERLLRDPEATETLLGAAQTRTRGMRAGKLSKVMNELKAMLRLVKAYVSGEYKAVAWESMVLVVAALIYLVSPVDVIPDVLPFGLADDATVLMFVGGLVHEELEAFMEWEAGPR